MLGRQFDITTLAQVVDQRPVNVLDDLAPAVDAAIVRETEQGMIFTHGLIRETLYDGLRTTVRAGLHARVLEVLERLDLIAQQQRLSELAHHAVAAASAGADRAVSYAGRAADLAMTRLAFEEAVRHCRMALRAADVTQVHTRTRADLLLRLAAACWAAGDVPEARDAAVAAADLGRALQDPHLLAQAALAYPSIATLVIHGDERRVGLLREALNAVPHHEHALRAHLLSQLPIDTMYLEGPARHIAADALDEARASGDLRALSSALLAQEYGSAHEPAPQDAPWLDEGLEVAAALRDPTIAIGFLLRKAYHHLELGRFSELDAAIDAHAQLAAQLCRPMDVWWAKLMRAMRLLYEGRYPEARPAITEAVTYGYRVAGPQSLSSFGGQNYVAMVETHPHEDLLAHSRHMPDEFTQRINVRAMIASLEARAGDRDTARRELAALSAGKFALLPNDRSRFSAMHLLTNLVMELGTADVADGLVELLEPYRGHVVTGNVYVALGPFDRDRGRLLCLLGRLDEAEDALRAGLDLALRTGGRPWAAHAARELAGVLHRLGRQDEARAHLDDALQTAQGLGMIHLERLALADAAQWESPAASVVVQPAAPTITLTAEGEYWTVTTPSGPARFRDTKGLRYLARLIANPGVEIHSMELVSEVGPSPAVARPEGLDSSGFGDLGPVLDARAKAAYRRRLDDLRDEIDEAESCNDPERATRAREEHDILLAELSRALGVGGRDRPQRSGGEQARVNVTKAIRSALRRLGEHDAPLAAQLAAAVRTGAFCSYQPLAGAPAWSVLSAAEPR